MVPEWVVPTISVIGGVVIAVIGNWDKLFRQQVRANYTDYYQSGDYARELRHLLEVSGALKGMLSHFKKYFEARRSELVSAHPSDAAHILTTLDSMSEEVIRTNDLIAALVPIYQNYYTLRDIQQLNKLYSTIEMRELTGRAEDLLKDYMPVQRRLEADMDFRMRELLQRIEQHV